MNAFDVFVVDPPWPKRKGGKRSIRPNQGQTLDYATLSVDEIFSLLDRDVFSQASANHAVFLWTVDQFLLDSESGMLDRGYRRHARFVWDKCNGVAPCFTVRYSHEYLIWFYKEKLLPIDTNQRGKFTTVIREPAREHSRKPDAAYAMIDKFYPNLKKMDVFSRERRPGWSQYGNQIDHFTKNEPEYIEEEIA